MQIPKEARKKARELFEAALGADRRVDSAKALSVADLVVKAAPRHAVQILKEFSRLVRLELASHHAVIETAVPLDESSKQAIFASLLRRDGGTVTAQAKVDPELIGGARIRLGSEVWDSSVRTRLQALDS
jgi:F-type H+-transporting ATPase subunit delta